jgi:hypothetical protein
MSRNIPVTFHEVNDTEITNPDGTITPNLRPLSSGFQPAGGKPGSQSHTVSADLRQILRRG